VTGVGGHERAVADAVGLARGAAAGGGFIGALEWLGVVEIVDGGLPRGWERTCAVWLGEDWSAELGFELPAAGAEIPGFREAVG
jgi:hypothetical protein